MAEDQEPLLCVTKYGDERFDKFWKLYPKHAAKPYAWVMFRRAKFSDRKYKEIMEALELQIKYKWIGKWKNYVPNPATWLNQERWNDTDFEVPQSTEEKEAGKKDAKEIAKSMMQKLLGKKDENEA